MSNLQPIFEEIINNMINQVSKSKIEISVGLGSIYDYLQNLPDTFHREYKGIKYQVTDNGYNPDLHDPAKMLDWIADAFNYDPVLCRDYKLRIEDSHDKELDFIFSDNANGKRIEEFKYIWKIFLDTLDWYTILQKSLYDRDWCW